MLKFTITCNGKRIGNEFDENSTCPTAATR